MALDNWNRSNDAAGLPCYQRTYADGTDVTIEMAQQGNSFSVKSSVESRTSGPVDTILGEGLDREEAQRLLEEACLRWDDQTSNQTPDWSKWTSKP